jgi:hypothetical protein
MRRAAAQRGQHVVQRRGAQRRDDPQSHRMRGQRPLACGVEQPERRQARAPTQEFLVQRARAQPLQRLDHHLQLATRFVNAQAAAQFHLLPIGRRKVHQRCGAAEHRAAQQRLRTFCILQREVAVPAGRTRKAAQLAAHRDGTEARGHGVAGGQQQRGHAPRHPRRRCVLGLRHAKTHGRRGPGTPQPRRSRHAAARRSSRNGHVDASA